MSLVEAPMRSRHSRDYSSSEACYHCLRHRHVAKTTMQQASTLAYRIFSLPIPKKRPPGAEQVRQLWRLLEQTVSSRTGSVHMNAGYLRICAPWTPSSRLLQRREPVQPGSQAAPEDKPQYHVDRNTADARLQGSGPDRGSRGLHFPELQPLRDGLRPFLPASFACVACCQPQEAHLNAVRNAGVGGRRRPSEGPSACRPQ